MQESLKKAIIKAGLASFFVFLCYIFVTWWGSWRRTQRCFWAALESAKFLILSKFSSVLLRPSKVYWLACITFFVSGPESVSAFDLSLLILIYCSGDVLVWQEPEDMEREAGFQFQRSRMIHDFSFWIWCRCSQNTGDLCRKMSHTSRLDKLQALRPGWTWVHQIDSNETYHTYHVYHYTSDASYAYHFTSVIGCLHHCQSGWEVMAHASEIQILSMKLRLEKSNSHQFFSWGSGGIHAREKRRMRFGGDFFPWVGWKVMEKRRKTQRMEIFRKTTNNLNFVGFLDFRSGAQGTRRASAGLEGQRTRWTSTGLEGLMLSLGHWWRIVLLGSKTEWSRK